MNAAGRMFFASVVTDGCSVADWLMALLTPVIAAIAVYIAYQQSRTNRRRLDLDLYDRRLGIYQATVEYISAVLTDFHPTVEVILRFRRSTAQVPVRRRVVVALYLNRRLRRDAARAASSRTLVSVSTCSGRTPAIGGVDRRIGDLL